MVVPYGAYIRQVGIRQIGPRPGGTEIRRQMADQSPGLEERRIGACKTRDYDEQRGTDGKGQHAQSPRSDGNPGGDTEDEGELHEAI